MTTRSPTTSGRELLVYARKAAAALPKSAALSSSRRLAICQCLLEGGRSPHGVAEFSTRLAELDGEHQHYWIGTFYTLLLPAAKRRAQAAYFTPPNLSNAILQLILSAGFDPASHTAVDPAAGGAAFLSTLAAKMRSVGVPTESIVQRLRGVEIDSGLARLSEALIDARLGSATPPGSLVTVADSLRLPMQRTYDLVIANPPYGRISPSELRGLPWEDVCHPGHINKYALFTQLCFRLAKPNGLVALVLPASLAAGPLYGRLRAFIRNHAEVLTFGAVRPRHDVFADVAQDVSVLVARAGAKHDAAKTVEFGQVRVLGPFKRTIAAYLPAEPNSPWLTPGKTDLAIGGASLADYGAAIRSGYFVWNRELDRMRTTRSSKLDVPLFWAANIKPGSFCWPKAKKRSGADYVHFDADSPAIIKADAVLLQRTTNSSQPRRLVAARVSPSVIKKWGGFVSENHTIVLTAPSVSDLNLLTFLLNSVAVDKRYRQVSGTASVSVALLRTLDLPSPDALTRAIERLGNCEAAIEEAYRSPAAVRAKVSA